MKFAKLRLSGFKSFVEPTELVIRQGLTGVVGPNGCGKSNLLEALRWVMGESSVRSLRVAAGGSGMDDVIFAGTAKRPSRDLAEVRLMLDNSGRTAPAEFNGGDEIEVSRAIVRGEGSTYSLNGREVRLKDVQLLFADAATGAHSPALVSQGRVAAIINAKPQERRQLLEEAAGISGLNVRRREAELRLRAADANLVRLDDVMKGAEAQAQGLRRQAKSAQRYRELSDRIRGCEAGLLRLQWAAAVEALQAAERELRDADARLAEAVQSAARAATAQADAAAGLPAKRQAEAAIAATVQRLTTERATLLAERQGLVKRLADLSTALGNAGADAERERARARDSAATQARLGEELDGQGAAQAEAARMMEPQAAEVRSAEQAATEAERALATAVEAHAALVAEARSVRAQAEAARGRAERLEGERKRLQAELDRLKAGGSGVQLEAQLAEAEAALAARTAEVEVAATAIGKAERAAQAARAAAETVERALAVARTEVASLEAEAAALERLRTSKQASAGAGARAAISARPGFEAAAAAALGDDLNAGLGAPEKPARHWLLVGARADDPALPPGCAPLSAQVTAPAELTRRLAQVGVVDGAPDAAAIAALRPGQRLVSRDGWLWRWDGFVAPPGGQAAAVAEALAQDNRRREIAEGLEAPRARVAAAEAELAAQKDTQAKAQGAEREARAKRAEAERARAAEAVMAAELSQGELDRAARAAEARVADGREARATLAARVEQLREKVSELVGDARERFGARPQELEAADGADAGALEQRLVAMRAERERIGVVNLRADIELAEIEAVLAEQTRERDELDTAINRLRGSIGTLNREGRARLMAAFAEVDRHFRELFVTLFGGGSAELTMIESDDPLEAGLEIRAQPPGKKLQSLSLLSGGEQALTAIALIFALFRTNPAPICVLDEVDAPLDDANVERFTRLLQHMADATDTRFLIVTHNAVTMAAMHRLYGVTMGEPGVSQLVSVELREAEQLVAA
ncbi:MAG: chromosome segregation SMC family protein [Sandaracinobacter sp.]